MSRALALLLALLTAPAAAPVAGPRVVSIEAKRFAFVPNEVRLFRRDKAILRLTSKDVTHGLLVRELGIDVDIPPGTPVDVELTPEVLGRFSGICGHFCGSGHGNMKLTVVVEDDPVRSVTGD